jgi:putative hydrolase of the HAD superfamily
VTARVRAVLFDLDDTLYPERQFVDGGFAAVAGFLADPSGRSAAVLAARLRELHDQDGRGRLFDTLLDEVGLGGEPDLVPACLLVYRAHPTRLTPFSGVVELLDGLHAAGVRTGVISDGNAAVQARKLAGLDGVAERLDVVVLTDDLGPGHAKPSRVPYDVACRLLAIDPSATIYAGNDPRKDFRGARAAGLRTIRVGPLPDEGGGATIAPTDGDEADLRVDSIEALAITLSGLTNDR